jgi:TRAP-type C4-dicarboxylate transport system substrate-binding protein
VVRRGGAQTAKEEREREAAADHVMTLATAYVIGASRSYPIMQLDLKENIQNATNGKVYVRLAPGGQLGAGGALAQAVQGGTIQCAQHSLSNFAPFASTVVDLINLPYFCGSNQRFTNLSPRRRVEVRSASQDRSLGLQGAVLHRDRPARCGRARRWAGPIMSPATWRVKFRVPGSAMLQQYYPWSARTRRRWPGAKRRRRSSQGVADALDPSVGALHVFGFGEILSHVTFTQAVPDSQVYSINLEWFNSAARRRAGRHRIRGRTHPAPEPVEGSVGALLRHGRIAKGVEFHSLSDDQLAEWKRQPVATSAPNGTSSRSTSPAMDTFAQARRSRGHHGPLLRPRRLIASGRRPRGAGPTISDTSKTSRRAGMPPRWAGRDHVWTFYRAIDQNAERWAASDLLRDACRHDVHRGLRREVLSYSSIWGEEIVRYSFIYLAWIGAAAAVRERGHIRIDVILNMYGPDGEIAALYVRRHRDVRRRRHRALLVLGDGARVLEIRLGHPRPPDRQTMVPVRGALRLCARHLPADPVLPPRSRTTFVTAVPSTKATSCSTREGPRDDVATTRGPDA